MDVTSTVASPICQEGQSERTFPICSLFFPIFSFFPTFSSLFSNFGHFFFFAVREDTLPHLDPVVATPLNVMILWGTSPVFPLRFLSLGQFYQLWQNLTRGSCTKIIICGWKLAKMSKKNIFLLILSESVEPFFKVLGQFCDIRGLRGNTVLHLMQWVLGRSTYLLSSLLLVRILAVLRLVHGRHRHKNHGSEKRLSNRNLSLNSLCLFWCSQVKV